MHREEPAPAGEDLGAKTMTDLTSPPVSEPAKHSGPAIRPATTARLIVNADDWGRDLDNTNRSLDCAVARALSSVSAMVFMEDSERAAEVARQHGIDCGLHLNLTTPFSAPQTPSRLQEHQRKLMGFLRSHRVAPALYHPFLASSFDYVVRAQREEFERLYQAPPARIDGHHHMHLCANVVRQQLLPAGTTVRRNFSFASGEKGAFNRWYRARQDKALARRHRMTDYFFSLPPLEPRSRIERMIELATGANVELETHPVKLEEYRFLMDGELLHFPQAVEILPGYQLREGIA